MKTCPLCCTKFGVTHENRAFYDKISPVFNGVQYLIPEPTLCQNCRSQRRTLHRNEQHLYHNTSAFSQKNVVSIYNPHSHLTVVSQEEWFSDTWDAKSFGRDFDFSLPFFDQFFDLFNKVPVANVVSVNCENSAFTTGTGYCKNCYLINCSEYCENCMYSKLLQNCRDVLDCSYCYDSELLYECISFQKGYNCIFVSYSHNSSDCYFCEDITGCHHCFLSTGLKNKSYFFRNKKFSKEEYTRQIRAFFTQENAFQKGKNELEIMRENRIHKYAHNMNSENSTGDFI